MISHQEYRIKEAESSSSQLKKYQINPEGSLKKVWDIIIVILLLYTATYSPYRTAFMADDFSQLYFVFELCVDSLFFLDIIISFLTPFQMRDDEYEYDSKKIANNYLLGPFFIDVIAILPTWAFEETDIDLDTDGSNKLFRLARLQRLYRLLRIFRVIKLIKINKYNSAIQKFVDKMEMERSTTRLIMILIVSLFLVHLFACFFYLSAKMNDFANNTWVV